MKIKLEIKPNSKLSLNPPFTLYMEDKPDETIEILITKLNITQMELPNQNPLAQKTDVPISDGILVMNKPNLKKFIQALQLLAK